MLGETSKLWIWTLDSSPDCPTLFDSSSQEYKDFCRQLYSTDEAMLHVHRTMAPFGLQMGTLGIFFVIMISLGTTYLLLLLQVLPSA